MSFRLNAIFIVFGLLEVLKLRSGSPVEIGMGFEIRTILAAIPYHLVDGFRMRSRSACKGKEIGRLKAGRFNLIRLRSDGVLG